MSNKKEKETPPIAGIVFKAGSAHDYVTGGWRNFIPVVDKEKCTDCLICWVLCPDSAVLVEDGKMAGFDMEHCKGCGVCAAECPPKFDAIKMEEEGH